MKKSDLKFGDIITYRNGNKRYVNYIENNQRKYNDDLTHVKVRDLDIMKVERYVYVYNICDCRKVYTLDTIYERKDILDEEEKEYLSNVIKPFKDKVEFIRKEESYKKEEEYIEIYLKSYDGFSLPHFKKDTMYKGMGLGKNYTLEELDL